jgi:hypothetical protein
MEEMEMERRRGWNGMKLYAEHTKIWILIARHGSPDPAETADRRSPLACGTVRRPATAKSWCAFHIGASFMNMNFIAINLMKRIKKGDLMPRSVSSSKAMTHVSVDVEKKSLSYVMKARKKKTAAETLQVLIDEEAERLRSWKVHREVEGKIPRARINDRLL